MGGKNNQFDLNGMEPFYHQHDIRRIPNGHLTLFDNHNQVVPTYSRGLELAVDEQARSLTLVREFRANPDTYAFATGSHRTLPNGNHLIGWGTSPTTALTEFAPDGSIVLQMSLTTPYINYRTIRAPWVGRPTTKPTVVVAPGASGAPTTIAYSWNGATEVAAYRVYGGMTKDSLKLVDAQVKTSFETTSTISAKTLVCEVQVVPLDKGGQPMQASEIVTNPSTLCQARSAFLPSVLR
jgi:hypothetical protein